MTTVEATPQVLWYTGQNGAHAGPFTEADVRGQVQSGTLKPTDYVWCPGWTEWKPAGVVFPAVSAPPPMPPPVVPVSPGAHSKLSETKAAPPAAVAPEKETQRAAAHPAVTVSDGMATHESAGIEPSATPSNIKLRIAAAAALVVCVVAAGLAWALLGRGGGAPRESSAGPPAPVAASPKAAPSAPAAATPSSPLSAPDTAKAAAEFEAVIGAEKSKYAERPTIGLASAYIRYALWLADQGKYAESRAQADLAEPVSLFHVIRNELFRRKAQAYALEAEKAPEEGRPPLWKGCAEAAGRAVGEGLDATQVPAEVAMLKGGLTVISRGIGNAYTLRGMCTVKLGDEAGALKDFGKAIEHLSLSPEEADTVARLQGWMTQLQAPKAP